MKRRKILLIGAALVLAGGAGTLAVLSVRSWAAPDLGVTDGRLAPCPDTPNCVCTDAADEAHHIDPLPYDGEDAMERLIRVVSSFPGAEIRYASNTYLRAEFTSPLFRFVDDVEFLVDEGRGVIQFRSASRVGRSDFGANRRRMEAIREAFADLPAAPSPPRPADPVSDEDREAIRGVIALQLEALECDDGALAFALAAPGIRQRFGTHERFLRMVAEGYVPVYRPRRAEFGRLLVRGPQAVQEVRVTGPDGRPVLALYPMERQPDGVWRTAGCSLAPAR